VSFLLRTERIKVATQGNGHIVDVTPAVAALVAEHHLAEGHVLLFVPGATGALTTVEYEPGLLRDLPELFERLAPRDAVYHHDETWHDGNGHSHVRASLLGPSLIVPVAAGLLTLGTWQQIVFVDFDTRRRRRELICQLFGTT
jgi:secondary thiamine-phosphate synthase enzyme